MSTNVATIIVPSANGTSADVDISTLAPNKQIIVGASSNFIGCITLEISPDGVNFAAVRSFTNATRWSSAFAGLRARVVVTGYVQGTATLSLGAAVGTNAAGTLNVPVGNGTGASLNVAALGVCKTVAVVGAFTGAVEIQVSTDGGTTWGPVGSFAQADQQTWLLPASLMRVVRYGADNPPGATPTVVVCGGDTSSGTTGIAIGDPITGGTPPEVLYVGVGGVLANDPGFTYDDVEDVVTAAGAYELLSDPAVPVSAAGGVRLRSNAGVLEVSQNGGAYTPIDATVTLQEAYDNGAAGQQVIQLSAANLGIQVRDTLAGLGIAVDLFGVAKNSGAALFAVRNAFGGQTNVLVGQEGAGLAATLLFPRLGVSSANIITSDASAGDAADEFYLQTGFGGASAGGLGGAGGNIYVAAGGGGAGAGAFNGGAGGALNFDTGAGGGPGATVPGGPGGVMDFTTGAGGRSAPGGNITMTAGAGGQAYNAAAQNAGDGGDIVLTTGTGGAGDTNFGTGNGGQFNLYTGQGQAGGAGGDVVFTLGAGGDAFAAINGGQGGDFALTAGDGGAGQAALPAGRGGGIAWTAGDGGTPGVIGVGASGGAIDLTSGNGSATGDAGNITVTGGSGGQALAAEAFLTGGSGGNISLLAGTGGVGDGARPGGPGGDITIQAGTGTDTGAAGTVDIASGFGGNAYAGTAGAVGGYIDIFASNGGSGSVADLPGAGGPITIQAGDAGVDLGGGGAAGGSVIIAAGSGSASVGVASGDVTIQGGDAGALGVSPLPGVVRVYVSAQQGNAVYDVLHVDNNMSAGAVGGGTGILFEGRDDVTTRADMGAIRTVWTSAAAGAEASTMDFYVVTGGALTSTFQIDPTGVTVTGKLTVTGAIDPTSLTLVDAGNAAYIQSSQGSGAAVSGANTGRLIYNATAQKWQVSENGGAYATLISGAAMAIGGTVTSGTTGRVLFIGAGPVLSQDNGLFWDNTNKRLGINQLVPSYDLEVGGSFACSAGLAFSMELQGGVYWDTDAGFAVGAAGQGAVRYNGNDLQLSRNGAAYAPLVGVACRFTSGTVGSVPFVATGPVLQQSNAQLFWDNTNSRLGVGTASPAVKVHQVIDDAVTNTVTDMIRLDHTTSGTAAANFAAGILFRLEDAGGTLDDAGRKSVFWQAASGTAASRYSQFKYEAIGKANVAAGTLGTVINLGFFDSLIGAGGTSYAGNSVLHDPSTTQGLVFRNDVTYTSSTDQYVFLTSYNASGTPSGSALVLSQFNSSGKRIFAIEKQGSANFQLGQADTTAAGLGTAAKQHHVYISAGGTASIQITASTEHHMLGVDWGTLAGVWTDSAASTLTNQRFVYIAPPQHTLNAASAITNETAFEVNSLKVATASPTNIYLGRFSWSRTASSTAGSLVATKVATLLAEVPNVGDSTGGGKTSDMYGFQVSGSNAQVNGTTNTTLKLHSVHIDDYTATVYSSANVTVTTAVPPISSLYVGAVTLARSGANTYTITNNVATLYVAGPPVAGTGVAFSGSAFTIAAAPSTDTMAVLGYAGVGKAAATSAGHVAYTDVAGLTAATASFTGFVVAGAAARVYAASGGIAMYVSGGTNTWTFNNSGHLVAATDNTWDIGASGATRPRNIFVGTDITLGGTLRNDGAGVALGGGAAPTLGTIGGSGPAVAAQNQWWKINIGGTSYYVPIWA